MTYEELKIWFRTWYKKESRHTIKLNGIDYTTFALKDTVTMYFTWINEDLKRNSKAGDSSKWYKLKLIHLQKELIKSGYTVKK